MAATVGLTDKIPLTVTPNARDFMEKCLQIDPLKRAIAGDLLQHPWVKQPKIGKGIIDILKQIFLCNNLLHLGF